MRLRAAAEIGAGLEPARAPRSIPAGARVHVVGAGGAAGAAAALHAHHAGARVSGCDAGGPSQYTAPLEALGVPIAWTHAADHVVSGDAPIVDRLAVTKALTSVHPDHPELLAARAAGVPTSSVQQLIADAAATAGQRLVGIAGTHGKSTTTGWVTHLLVASGLDPSAFVGALLSPDLVDGPRPSTARFGRGGHFIVEADEYAGNFDPYRPAIGALTNADWDHPDVFADRAAVVAAFAAWIRAFDGGGEPPVLVANAGDAGVREVLGTLSDWHGRRVLVALVDADADLAGASDAVAAAGTAPGSRDTVEVLLGRWLPGAGGASSIEVHGIADPSSAPVLAELGLGGRHNAENALVAAAVARAAGAGAPDIAAGLASFRGVGRRLELKGDVGGVVVLDDYGHHPTAMAATFATVAARYPGRRLWAVYEPLTYHRTAAMLEAFADVLARADRVVIAQIHAGRDPDTTITSAAALAAAVEARGGPPAWAPGTVEETADWLATRLAPGDVVLVMGGGRSYVIAERLVGRLRGRDDAAPPTGQGGGA